MLHFHQPTYETLSYADLSGNIQPRRNSDLLVMSSTTPGVAMIPLHLLIFTGVVFSVLFSYAKCSEFCEVFLFFSGFAHVMVFCLVLVFSKGSERALAYGGGVLNSSLVAQLLLPNLKKLSFGSVVFNSLILAEVTTIGYLLVWGEADQQEDSSSAKLVADDLRGVSEQLDLLEKRIRNLQALAGRAGDLSQKSS